eukprot:1227462-Rhodomonas_salina.5
MLWVSVPGLDVMIAAAVLPAGERPSPRAGHAAVHDQASYQMVVHGGMQQGSILSDEVWTLDMQSKKWHCESGSCSTGNAATGAGPGPLAFQAAVGTGLFLFSHGGVTGIACVGTPAVPLPVISSDLWALNLASYEWYKVDIQDGPAGRPAARALSQMVSLGQAPGFNQLVGMLGGANFDCYTWNPPCMYPQPMNDLWMFDAAPAESDPVRALAALHLSTEVVLFVFSPCSICKDCAEWFGMQHPPQTAHVDRVLQGVDYMASFDGVDDIITIDLPSWCNMVCKLTRHQH